MLLLATLAGSAAGAHGLERHYGTSINDVGSSGIAAGSGGSPAFPLLVIQTTAAAMNRALDDGHVADARERARRLPEMARELRRRAEHLEPGQRERVAEAASAVSEGADRVYAMAGGENLESLRMELAHLRRLVASMQMLLRETLP